MTLRFDLVADAEQEGGQEDEVVVGMGHAHRCLALGEALRKKGGSVRLFLPDPLLGEKMFSHLAGSKFSPGSSGNVSSDLSCGALSYGALSYGSWEELWQEEGRELREMLVVDSYRLASLPAGVRDRYQEVACFHDSDPPAGFATVAICCDLSTKNCVGSFFDGRSFCGGQYFPFHDRFAGKRASAEKRKGRLLLWWGGRDSGESLAPLLTKDVLGSWRAKVVISPVVAPCAELLALSRRRARGNEEGGSVRVYNDAGAMDALLPRCEAYLGGAGVAACEAALLGLKLILCPVAENQRGNARAFEKAGAMVLRPPLLPERVRTALRAIEIETEHERRPSLNLEALGLDGKGAERLAQSLCDPTLYDNNRKRDWVRS